MIRMDKYLMQQIIHPETHLSLLEILHKIQLEFDKINKRLNKLEFEIKQLKRDKIE